MSKPVKVEPEEIPSVLHYLEMEARVKNLMDAYPGVFEEYREVIEQRNTALEVAEKDVRARMVSCGTLTLDRVNTTYEPQALYDAVGREKFLELGGSEQMIKQYDIDKKVFEANIAQGKVLKNVLDAVKKDTPYFKIPKKILVP